MSTITPQDSEKKQNAPVQPVNIFAQKQSVSSTPKKSLNIFSNNLSSQPAMNIFSKSQPSINLFNLTTLPSYVPKNTNIFNSRSKPIIKNESDSQDDSQKETIQLNKQKEFKSQPQKYQMKFQYENKWIIIKSIDLVKFKNGVNVPKQNVYLNVETHKDQPNNYFIMIRAKITKLVLFQAFLVKGISNKIEHFSTSKNNIKMVVLRQKNEEPTNNDEQRDISRQSRKVLARENLKMQFEKEEDVENFKKLVEQLLSQRKGENQQNQSNQEKTIPKSANKTKSTDNQEKII